MWQIHAYRYVSSWSCLSFYNSFFYLSHRLMCSMMSFIHRYIIPHSYVHLLPFSFCLQPSPMQVIIILHTYLILLHMRNNTLFFLVSLCSLIYPYSTLLPIRKVLIKSLLRFQSTLVRMAIISSKSTECWPVCQQEKKN